MKEEEVDWDSPEFFDVRKVLERFETGICKTPGAKNVLEKLIKAGANRMALLLYLALATGDERAFFQKTIQEIKEKQDRLRRFVAQLDKVARLAEKLSDDLIHSDSRWVQMLELESEAREPGPLVLPTELKSMRDLGEYTRRRESELGAILRRKINPSGQGRIAVLSKFVQETTGEYFDNDVADLFVGSALCPRS